MKLIVCLSFFPLLITVRAAVSNVYNDTLAREILMPLASAAYASDPKPCLNNVLDGATLNRRIEVPCDSTGKNTCSGYTWIDESRRMIGLVFRGTNADEQFEVELPSILADRPRKFHNGGQVVQYFNDGFLALWKNGSMGTNILGMSRKYPDFDLYITGHSLGGAMAAISAAYIVSSGLHPPNRHTFTFLDLEWKEQCVFCRVILYTFGEPRIGDAQFARHLGSSITSYRIVHNKDMAPHIPFRSTGYQHHGTEVFYENDMKTGAPFVICKSNEDATCSGKFHVIETNFGTDHVHYFGENILAFGQQGCKRTH